MTIEKIKPLVSDYAKNLSLLFVTNKTEKVRQYINYFKFLFKKSTLISDTKNTLKIYDEKKGSIDIIIVHISGDVKEFKKLIKAIRRQSNEIFILAFTTNTEKRISFNLNARYHVDGFIPIPFDKDKIYFYLFRLLKRIVEKKELDVYVKELELVHDEFLNIEERFENYVQKLKNVEHIDRDKLITELCNIKNRVNENFEIENSYIQERKKSTKNTITKKKLNDIRFTEHDKMTAIEFIETLDDTIVDKAEDFLERLNTYVYTLDNLMQSDATQSISHIASLTAILREFYYTVDTLAIFPVIVRTFDNIIHFLYSLSAEQLEDVDKKSILILTLEGLGNDLESWITHIFIERTTDNIHYLDASFANNALEMEAIFTQTEIESDEDDLEFF